MFKDLRFPPNISFGAIGGPAFLTEVAQVNSGVEARNQVWVMELGRWEVGHNARLPGQYIPLQAFFRIMAGRANSFRFKDWTDFTVTGSQGVVVSGQLYKLYDLNDNDSPSSGVYLRKITLPVYPITLVGGGTVDYSTGIVSGGSPTAWSGEFDCLARFDTDQMKADTIDKKLNGELIIGWASIPIVELRQP